MRSGSMTTMTDLLSRPLRVDPPTKPSSRSVPLRAAVAAAWAVLLGLLGCVFVAVAGWLAGSSGTATDALRVGADGWLLAHGSALQVSGTTVALVPLGLTIGFGALLYRSGAWAGAASGVAHLRAATGATAVLAACYGLAAALVAVLAGTSEARPDPVRAFVGAVALAALCGGSGLVHGAGLGDLLARAVPARLRAAASGVVAGVVVLLAAGSMLVIAGLVADFSAAQAAASSLEAGVVGGSVLALLGIVVLPNAAVWAAAFAAGPGFTLGSGTLVDPTDVRLGPVPAFPLFAALPGEGPQPWWVSGLVVVPVVAGAVAAAVALRHHRDGSAGVTAALAGCTAAAAGVLFGLLTLLSAASGPGRLSGVGPSAAACTLAAAAAMALGGLLAWGGWWLRARGHAAAGAGKESATG